MKVILKIELDDKTIKALNNQYGVAKKKSEIQSLLLSIINADLEVISSEYEDSEKDSE